MDALYYAVILAEHVLVRHSPSPFLLCTFDYSTSSTIQNSSQDHFYKDFIVIIAEVTNKHFQYFINKTPIAIGWIKKI